MRAVLLILATLAATPARADCDSAAAQAERAAGIPAGLLAAIGQVESGRRPLVANEAGRDRVFASLDEAEAAVAARRAAGVRSIDVGCFQVNLMHHPNAFATLRQAFDPTANATYAARFLNALHAQSGSWAQAVADYHSRNRLRGAPYRDAVLAVWAAGGLAPPPAMPRIWPGGIRVYVPSWAAPPDGQAAPPGLPVVITPSTPVAHAWGR